MSINTPIFSIAKDLNVESNRILLACKKLGINAKGATKRLNEEELEKIKSYFKTGKNVSDEVINLNKVKTVPYKHNYGYFFTSGPNTWHGMEKKEIKKERR